VVVYLQDNFDRIVSFGTYLCPHHSKFPTAGNAGTSVKTSASLLDSEQPCCYYYDRIKSESGPGKGVIDWHSAQALLGCALGMHNVLRQMKRVEDNPKLTIVLVWPMPKWLSTSDLTRRRYYST
jgi:hypothetical protein